MIPKGKAAAKLKIQVLAGGISHERDISHSSVERIVLPDSALLAYYVMRRMTRLLDGLQVFPQRMLDNLWASHGLVFSQPVLLGLVQAGLTRDEAYRIVQENAGRAWDEGRSFRELLEADPRVTVDAAVLDDAFDLQRSVRHAGLGVDQLDALVMGMPWQRIGDAGVITVV